MSRSERRAASSAVTSPEATAFCRTFSRFTPLPSSWTSTTTWPPSWKARTATVPSSGLPAAARFSGRSTPWSTALRTRWTSGSLIASSSVLSSSVSAPAVTSRTFLPVAWAASRQTRGRRVKTLSIGCIRAFITDSCRPAVRWSMRWLVSARRASSRAPSWQSSWLRASTSSPTRFMSRSSTITGTRSEPPSVASGAWGWSVLGAVAAGGGATSGGAGAGSVVAGARGAAAGAGAAAAGEGGAAGAGRRTSLGAGRSGWKSGLGGSAAGTGGAGVATSAGGGAGWPATGSGGGRDRGSSGGGRPELTSAARRRAISSAWPSAPSRPVLVIASVIARRASSTWRRMSVMGRDQATVPSRMASSRSSAACESSRRWSKPRNPAVPLTVWKTRNVWATTSDGSRPPSTETRSRSRVLRSSTSSDMNSSSSSLSKAPPACDVPPVCNDDAELDSRAGSRIDWPFSPAHGRGQVDPRGLAPTRVGSRGRHGPVLASQARCP